MALLSALVVVVVLQLILFRLGFTAGTSYLVSIAAGAAVLYAASVAGRGARPAHEHPEQPSPPRQSSD